MSLDFSMFPIIKEGDIHLHVAEERSDLFSTIDGTSTEIETLNLLNALIYYYKPKRVLETGTFIGFGTIAIADALRRNGFGFVHSIEKDIDGILKAYENIKKYDKSLMDYLEIYESDTLSWIKKHTDLRFDMGFFDSDLTVRAQEIKTMLDNHMFNKGFIAFIHDTSPHRVSWIKEEMSDQMFMNMELDKIGRGRPTFEGQLSRGWRMIQL